MRDTEQSYREQVERAKKASVAQLLFKCARLVNDLAVARVQSMGAPKLRAAHTSLFPHLDLEGTRLTVLARRLGVSKQAVNQLVDDLCEMKMLERVPDPTDGRAKLIRFTRTGRNNLLQGLAVLSELEQDLAVELGKTHMKALHRALLKLERVLEEGAVT